MTRQRLNGHPAYPDDPGEVGLPRRFEAFGNDAIEGSRGGIHGGSMRVARARAGLVTLGASALGVVGLMLILGAGTARATTSFPSSSFPSSSSSSASSCSRAQTAAPTSKLAIRAGKIHTGLGTVIEEGVILIRDGKIERVGARLAVPDGYRLIDRSSSVVMPGMVDLATGLGGHGDLLEPTDAVTPGVHASTAFNPGHPDFAAARAAGITTALLVPSPANVVGGRAAVVKTGSASGMARLVDVNGPFVLAMGRSALQAARMPTSLIGLRSLMREVFAEARAEAGNPLAGLAAGKEIALVRASARDEIEGVLDLVESEGVRTAIVGAGGATDLAKSLGEAGIAAVMGPLDLETSERLARLPAKLAEAGVPVAFTSTVPEGSPDTLRLSAALAVTYGMKRDPALAALTRIPAQIAGLGEQIGTIAKGKDADLVVLSGDPLDLRSRVEDVFVDGLVVHHVTGVQAPWEASRDAKEER